MKRIRSLALICAGLMVVSACGIVGGGDEPEAGGNAIGTEEATTSPADATITIRSERDTVMINDEAIASGQVQDGVAGDDIAVDGEGSVTITAQSVLEIEALRGGTLTVPDLGSDPIVVPMKQGHVFVRTDPGLTVPLVIDTGDRKFTTKAPGSEFVLCQSPEGASCLAVTRGEVQWFEDGLADETYSAGEASFAAPGAAPDPSRCADDTLIGEMRRQLRGQEFDGALADIVSTWEECPADGAEAVADDVVKVPSAARMEHVIVDEITIGSTDIADDSESGVAQKTIDGSADFYIEPLAVTNSEFRTWLANTAGDDPDIWGQYAPSDWLDRAPGGSATQAIYADGSADEAVKGVAYPTAVEFCGAQAKRLPTEIEWELAATSDVLEDVVDEAHDWVSEWEAYGPGPDDSTNRQVLRGANGTLQADVYYRVFAVDTLEANAARREARIRCAATEVAIGGQAFDNTLIEDDFNSLEWAEVDGEVFELGYHPDNFHLDVSDQHSSGAVVKAIPDGLKTGRIDTDLFVERNNTGTGDGKYRFGVVFGRADELYTLTLQPDEFTGERFTACIMPLSEELAAGLELGDSPLEATGKGRHATIGPSENHLGEDCVDAESSVEVPVANIDSPVRLTVVSSDGKIEAWVNDVLVESSVNIGQIDIYGFVSQTYHRPRSHIHFDDLLISA